MILGDSVKLTSSGKREFNFIIAKVSKRIENRRHVKMLYKKHKNNTILKALSNDPNDIPFPVFVVQSLRFLILKTMMSLCKQSKLRKEDVKKACNQGDLKEAFRLLR